MKAKKVQGWNNGQSAAKPLNSTEHGEGSETRRAVLTCLTAPTSFAKVSQDTSKGGATNQVSKGIVHAKMKVLDKRVDEIFFIDLPSAGEREEIFTIHLKKAKWGKPTPLRLIEQTEGFVGAEIAQAVTEARIRAFGTEEGVTIELLQEVIAETVPLSRTMESQITWLRDWATHRCRRASPSQATPPPIKSLPTLSLGKFGFKGLGD